MTRSVPAAPPLAGLVEQGHGALKEVVVVRDLPFIMRFDQDRSGQPPGVWALTVAVVRRADDQVGFCVSHRRWVVERTLAWFSEHRRCVRDYEGRIDTSEAMVTIAMIMTMSRRLAR